MIVFPVVLFAVSFILAAGSVPSLGPFYRIAGDSLKCALFSFFLVFLYNICADCFKPAYSFSALYSHYLFHDNLFFYFFGAGFVFFLLKREALFDPKEIALRSFLMLSVFLFVFLMIKFFYEYTWKDPYLIFILPFIILSQAAYFGIFAGYSSSAPSFWIKVCFLLLIFILPFITAFVSAGYYLSFRKQAVGILIALNLVSDFLFYRVLKN